MGFVVYRVQKLARGSRGKGTIGQSLRHLAKHKESAEISRPDRLKDDALRMVGDYKKVMQKIDANIADHNKHNARGFRSDAAVACEMILSYSPDENNQNKAYELQYEAQVLQYIKEKFPTMQVLAIARHCSESSTHWHVIATSYDKERHRVSIREMIGGPAQLRKQQTELAERLAVLGLKRGMPKEITNSIHKTKSEYNRQKLLHIEKEAQTALDDIFRDDR